MSINNKYKLFRRRLLASLIDGIILLGPLIAITTNALRFENYKLVFYLMIIYPFIQIAYSVLCHYYYGQTLGKSIVDIKVYDISETQNISLKQALYRDSIWISIEILGLLVYFLNSFDIFTEKGFFNFVTDLAESFASYWLIIEILTMMTNKKRRAVHDFIAKTVVIRI